MSKVDSVNFLFALLLLVIGPRHLRHFLSQSELKPKAIVTYSRAISRATSQQLVFASSFDRLNEFFVASVICQNDNFAVSVFQHPIEKCSILYCKRSLMLDAFTFLA